MSRVGQHSIPVDILDDLSSRFIINVPEEERKDLVRIMFQIELAHWFYLDFYCGNEMLDLTLTKCAIQEFARHMFHHIPSLRQHASKLDTILEQWREYKQWVPTYGAILLDEQLEKVLLVQGFWSKSSWGFPKGKVNEDEDPCKCAIREVLEETGYNISKQILEKEYIEATFHEQTTRLYLIPSVPRDTKFVPRTRNEIRAVEWFNISDLPVSKKDMTVKSKSGTSANAFFMVMPFMKQIKKYIWKVRKAQNCTKNTKVVQPAQVPPPPVQSTQQKPNPSSSSPMKEKKKRSENIKAASRKLFQDENGTSSVNLLRSNEYFFSAATWSNFSFDKNAIFRAGYV